MVARLRLVVLIVVLGWVAAACGGASDAGGGENAAEGGGGALEPLADGFPDQPINLIVVDEPGSRDGIYARTLERALEGVSPVEIVVTDEPEAQGGTIPMVGDVAQREGGAEGYYAVVGTVAGSVTDLHIEPIEDEFGIGLSDVSYLIVTERQPYVIAQRADAPWGASFGEFLDYAEEHPGELRYLSNGVGSGHDIAMEWIMANRGIEVNKIPAAGHQEALAAIGAGEGDFTMTQADLARTNEEAGRVDVIFTSTPEVPAPWSEEGEGVAAAGDYGEYGLPDADWGIVLGLLVPAEVPDEHKEWLLELFTAAAESDVYAEREETIPGVQADLLTTAEANELATEIYESSEPIIRDIGLHHEDN